MNQTIQSETFLNQRIELFYHKEAAAYVAMVNSKPFKQHGTLVIDTSKESLIKAIREVILKWGN